MHTGVPEVPALHSPVFGLAPAKHATTAAFPLLQFEVLPEPDEQAAKTSFGDESLTSRGGS